MLDDVDTLAGPGVPRVADDWPLDQVLAAKGARDGQRGPARRSTRRPTVGAIVAAIRSDLSPSTHPLVDEIVVMDSGSSDATAEVARRRRRDRRAAAPTSCPSIPVLPGKGEVLWRSLAATTGDVARASSTPTCEDFSVRSVVTALRRPAAHWTVPSRLVKGALRPAAARRRAPAARRRRPGDRAGRPPAAQPALARAGRSRPAAGRGVRRPARAAGAAAVPDRLRRRARSAHRHPRACRPGRDRPGRPRRPPAPPPGRRRPGPDGRRDLAGSAAPARPNGPHARAPTGSAPRSPSSSATATSSSSWRTTSTAPERPPMHDRSGLHPRRQSGSILRTPLAC